MARSGSRSTVPTRGRTVARQRSRSILPLVVLFVVVLGAGLLFWQISSAGRTSAARPIATLPSQDTHAIVWSPADTNTIFFGHHNGLLKSTDGGRSWQATSLASVDAMGLATSPRSPQRVYVAGHGIFRRSDDGGVTWTSPASIIQGTDIHGFAQSPADPDRLYALVMDQGILSSADGGATWTLRSNPGAMMAPLAVSSDGKTLLMGTERGVSISTDDGATWTASSDGLPGATQVAALAAAPNGDTEFAGTTNGLYRRTGAKARWDLTGLKGPILAVTANPLRPNTVLAVDDQQLVYRSDDGGTTWNGATR